MQAFFCALGLSFAGLITASVALWLAFSVYVLVAILRKELGVELSLSQMLQVLSVNVFEQVPLVELFANSASYTEALDSHNQLMLWN
jgi:hypothetical protein